MNLLVGGVPEHFNLPWQQAIETSAFAMLDVNVEFKTYHGGTGAMTRALKKGEIDLALLLTEGCLTEQLNGSPLRIVKTFVQSPLIWGIHVAADSDIESVSQIQGRRYAISRAGSGSHLMAIVDAAERGWPTDELEFVTVKNLTGARRALTSGEADIFFWEKYTTQPYVDLLEFRRVGIRKTLWPAFVVAGHEEFLDQHALIVRRVLEITNRICAELMRNPLAIPLIAERYELDREQVAEWFGLTRWSLDFERPIEALQIVREYLERLGLVPESKKPIHELWWNL